MLEDKDVSKLKCKIYRVRYQRDFFAICECSTETQLHPDFVCDIDSSRRFHFIALGDGLCVVPGREIILSGRWEYSDKYKSWQLKINDCFDHVGTSREEIVAYLSSKILKGIGKKTAEAIYERFGEKSLDVIEENPKALLEVSGIKEKKLAGIVASYEKNLALHALTKLLSPFGITYKTIVRIHRKLGEGSAALIRANPYCLCDMAYFGFKKTDEIALKMGDFLNSDCRIQGAILYVLRNAQQDGGHLFLPLQELLNRCCSDDVLNCAGEERILPDAVKSVLNKMLDEEIVKLLVVESNEASGVAEQCVYLRDNFIHETLVAEAISAKLCVVPMAQEWDSIIRDTEDALGSCLDKTQRIGALMALSSPISVITGGPGTGKTTGLRVVVESFAEVYPKKKIQLAAPTGRAARRMAEQTGRDAKTLHSLLHLTPDSFTDFYAEPDDAELVAADFLVIDEASMIDAQLMAELMFRLPAKTQVLFLGDIDQLPSVGAGNVLRQLLSCDLIPHVKLEKIFRQADGSVIPVNAANIKNGLFQLTENKYFKIIRCASEEAGAEAIVALHRRCLEKGLIDATQVLCPMRRRGATGTNQLNKALQELVNPWAVDKPEVEVGQTLFRVGDKVIQTRNIEDVSNGDIGFIQGIFGSQRDGDFLMRVYFESCGKEVEYDYEAALDLELAYAITIHKSQGSEFPAIIVPVFKSMGFFLCRNLLYTAVTRAREQVVIVTDLDARGVAMAIGREDSSRRNTVLGKLVRDVSFFDN